MKLQLSLKTKWWNMSHILDGKSEDYRDLTSYWYARLCLYNGEKMNKAFWEYAPRFSLSFDSYKISFFGFDLNVWFTREFE